MATRFSLKQGENKNKSWTHSTPLNIIEHVTAKNVIPTAVINMCLAFALFLYWFHSHANVLIGLRFLQGLFCTLKPKLTKSLSEKSVSKSTTLKLYNNSHLMCKSVYMHGIAQNITNCL